MRYLLTIFMFLSLYLAPPAFGETFCEMEGPNNCGKQIEDALLVQTHKTINTIHLTQDAHPFKTQNDEVLAQAASRSSIAAREVGQQNQPKERAQWWN